MKTIDLGHRDGEVKKQDASYRNLLLPWNAPGLEDWTIVGMNHYFVNGVKHLYVAMTHTEMCYAVFAEGTDEAKVFDELVEAANKLMLV